MSLALAAQKTLAESGVPVRVVSMPCTSVFDRQDAAWREAVLPKGLPRVAIEAGVTDYWRKYVGLEGARSASTASASRRLRPTCTSSWASTPSISSPRCAALSDVISGLVVRAAKPEDAQAISHVHRESWRTTYAGILPVEVIAREAGRKTEIAWRQWLEHQAGLSTTYVAELPGEGIVGFAFCGEARAPIDHLEAEIYALYVLQSHQRRGIGAGLVRECARHFVRHGLFGFYLWVLKANRARLFYSAIGGEVVAERTERLRRASVRRGSLRLAGPHCPRRIK